MDAVLSSESLLLLILGHLGEHRRLLVLRCCKTFALLGIQRQAQARAAFESLRTKGGGSLDDPETVCYSSSFRIPRGCSHETRTYFLNANGFITIKVDSYFRSYLGTTIHWPTKHTYFAPWSRTMVSSLGQRRIEEDSQNPRLRAMLESSRRLV